MSDSSSPPLREVSLRQVYCVVYRLLANEWHVTGDGWSVVSLFRDVDDGSHRLVGWTVDSHAVVLNVLLTPDVRYKAKTEDFHKMRDEEGRYWGFGFYKKDEALSEANRFMALVLQVRKQPLAAAPLAPHPVAHRASSTPSSSVGAAHGHSYAHAQEQKVNALLPPVVPTTVVRSVPLPSAALPPSSSASPHPPSFVVDLSPSQRPTLSSSASLPASASSSPRSSRMYPQLPATPTSQPLAPVPGRAPPAPLYPAINPTNSYPGPALGSPLNRSRASPLPPSSPLSLPSSRRPPPPSPPPPRRPPSSRPPPPPTPRSPPHPSSPAPSVQVRRRHPHPHHRRRSVALRPHIPHLAVAARHRHPPHLLPPPAHPPRRPQELGA